MVTTTEFLKRVKNEISYSTYQGRFSDEDILQLANEEQRERVTNLLTTLREEFFVRGDSIAVPANTPSIDVPERSVGRGVRMVNVVTANGLSQPIPRVNLEDVYSVNVGDGSSISGIYFEDDEIKFVPVPTQPFTVNIRYAMRPSEIVQENRTMRVDSVNLNQVTFNKVNPIFKIGMKCDFTKRTAGYRPAQISNEIANINGNIIEFVDEINPKINNNYQISLAGETSIIQLPDEVTSCLVTGTALQMLQSGNFVDQAKELKEKLLEKVRITRDLLSPRDKSSSQSVISQNGLLRQGRNFYLNRRVSL